MCLVKILIAWIGGLAGVSDFSPNRPDKGFPKNTGAISQPRNSFCHYVIVNLRAALFRPVIPHPLISASGLESSDVRK